MKSLISSITLALSFLTVTNSTAAKLNEKIDIPSTTHTITIDGVIDEDAWQQAKIIKINNVTWPDENVASPVKTTAYVIEDGSTLYVAFKAMDPEPENIRAVLSDRDSNWGDDRVGIKIDTYNDQTLAYQFFINPLGTQSDVIENEITKRESSSWNAIWDSAGKINDDGYVVEVAIPLRALNFDDSLNTQTWAMEFLRFYPREKELRISNTTIDHDNSCWICQMVPVVGFEGAKQGKNFTAVPTFVSGYSQTRDTAPLTDWDSESNSDVGLDLKWGITPDITLNATINPDFSQVEADAGQINVNNSFALFLPEKRSFFLSNQDYFSTPVNLIYTRNINDPDYGAKVTGKIGEHSFGAFAANDQSTSFILPGNLGSDVYTLEEKSTNAAFRYRFAFTNDFAVGSSVTVRESDSYHNYVTSVDSKLRLSKNDTLTAQFVQSDTEMTTDLIQSISDETAKFEEVTDNVNNTTTFYCDDVIIAEQDKHLCGEQSLRAQGVSGSDTAYRIDYRHNSRDYFYYANHQNVGQNFRADLAFIDKVDRERTVIGGGRIWRGDNDTWWNRIELEGDWDITYDSDGHQYEQEGEMYLNIGGDNAFFTRNGFEVRERTSSRINQRTLSLINNANSFVEKEFRSWTEYKPTANTWVASFFKFGELIDKDNNQLADAFNFSPRFNVKLGQHLSSRLTYRYNRLDKDSNNIYVAQLIDFRLTYQFSIRSFLRLSMVHYDLERNLDNYNEDVRDDFDAKYSSLSTQLLYSYKINPQTLFFAGYSDNGYQDDEVTSFTKDERSVFLKLSYAWLL